MHNVTTAAAFALLATTATAASAPMDMSVDRLLDICAASSVAAAASKGDGLGWTRLTDAQRDEWRRNFLAYNGGTLEHVGWRRDPGSETESLSFWVAAGPNGHTACAYSAAASAGLLEALTERLGKPDTLDKTEISKSVSAVWAHGAVEYYFTQVGARMGVNISRRR